jgi:hypothetical protein
VKLRCYLSSLLRIHHPDCKHCARGTPGDVMRKRLEELGWRTQPCSPEVVGVFDSQPGEIITLPLSLKARRRSA